MSAFAAMEQRPDGNFVDPVSHAGAAAYSQAMFAAAAIWTWRSAGDPQALAFGERMLHWLTSRPPGPVSSFFELGAAVGAYAMLPRESAVREPLRQWLLAFPVPAITAVRYRSNHDLVLAEALVALCRLQIRPDSVTLCAIGRHLVDAHLVRGAVHYTVRAEGQAVTVYVDPPHAPPAYQQLVVGYLAHLVSADRSPDRAAVRALLAEARGTLAMAAPDGDAAYWGRSQEESWAPVLGAYGLRVAARLARDGGEAARFRAVADAMVHRFDAVYAGGPYGLHIVPAMIENPFTRPAALDDYASVANYAGLTAVALTWLASEPTASATPAGRGRVVASLFPIGEDAFATVRRGDAWFALREHGAFRHAGDLRSDFGLLAAECRGAGGWRPLLAVRPHTTAGMDSAGPILRAGGHTGYPDGAALSLARDGSLIVTGGWRDRRGRWLRRARFRFTAISRGLRISFPVHRRDRVTYAVFAERPRASAGGIIDEHARTSLSLPVRRTFTAGFASSDSSHLTRATLTTTVRRATRLTIVVRSAAPCGRPF